MTAVILVLVLLVVAVFGFLLAVDSVLRKLDEDYDRTEPPECS